MVLNELEANDLGKNSQMSVSNESMENGTEKPQLQSTASPHTPVIAVAKRGVDQYTPCSKI